MENSNQATPATVNQIDQKKPSVPRSYNLLTGNIANSFNGGHYRPICWKEVMADEDIGIYGANMHIQLLTPLTPAYQKLRAHCQAFFVPHIRVWKNYEKFFAQQGGSSEEKIAEMPNFAGKTFPTVLHNEDNERYSFQETTAWRDSFASCYIPRMGIGTSLSEQDQSGNQPFNKMPASSALLLRGYVAINNDYLRNKEYAAPQKEYVENDTVSDEEWNSYIFNDIRGTDYMTGRARRDNSYYTNYRTELQGFEQEAPSDQEFEAQNALINFATWQQQTAEARAQAENSQKTLAQITSELRGSKLLTQGRVTLIGSKTFDINYSSITQNAYNNNEDIEEEFRVMGKQGAYSYTNIDLAFINNIKFDEDGYIHVIMSVTADGNVFESAWDRTLLNINWMDRYRPDLKDEKNDVLYNIEMGTPFSNNDTAGSFTQAVGFKRKFNELFKLSNTIAGDLSNRGYFQQDTESSGENDIINGLRLVPNSTYQFFELSAQSEYYERKYESFAEKSIWLDYTDLLIAKNLAVEQNFMQDRDGGILLTGHNQIILVGKTYCITSMPVDESIKNNFTKWGES